jgi:hypothetical protein
VATEAKPFASLSSGLLARKGAARPAMKPQGFGQMGGGNLEDLGWNDMGFDPPKPTVVPMADPDRSGGDEAQVERPHPTGLTPIQSPVHTQQAELETRFSPPELDTGLDEAGESEEAQVVAATPLFVAPASSRVPKRPAKPRAAPGSKAKAAFTLRLDPGRHLKLRLACAVTGRSAQQLVTDALDALLGDMPELDAMAEKANRKG